MRYKVLWTQTAQQDLRRIVEYIAVDGETKTKSVYSTVKEKADSLRQMPLQGRVVPELRDHGVLMYRELIAAPWRIIYKTEDDNIWVLAVIDGRRNMDDILLDRLI